MSGGEVARKSAARVQAYIDAYEDAPNWGGPTMYPSAPSIADLKAILAPTPPAAASEAVREALATMMQHRGWQGSARAVRSGLWDKDLGRFLASLSPAQPEVERPMVCAPCDMHVVFSKWCGHCLELNGLRGPKDAPTVAYNAEALDWFSTQRRLSLDFYSPMYGDDDDQSEEWRVSKESGPINDREWDIIGRGVTAAEAIIAARSALNSAEVKS